MTTLHLTNAYHPHSGGIRTFYHALLDAAPRHRRLVRLVVPGEADDVRDINAFARIYVVKAPRSPVVDSRYRLILPHAFVAARGPLWDILDRERPDVVEICDKYSLPYFAGLIRTRRRRRPVLVGLSCERMDDNVRAFLSAAGSAERFARWYMRSVYVPQFDAHIANSRYTAGELPLNPRHPRQVFVCPMGVDTTTFTPARRNRARRARLRADLGVADGAPLLMYAGRLSREKNPALLLDMLPGVTTTGARLLIVGDGPLREELASRAAREFPHVVRFAGPIRDRGALADLLTDADVFVHPNPREPFGIAPLEAMAAGLPVVAPDRGGVTTYATQHNAWLAAPDGDRFADAVCRAVTDREARERRRWCGLETAASLAWPATAASFFNLYDYIAQRRSRETEVPVPVPRAAAGIADGNPSYSN